jgi:3-oxoacyl-[acyl-carrier protein] reductase
VLVTGASRGIGLAVARSFALAGHRVAGTYSSTPSSTPLQAEGIHAVRCDVTDPAQLQAAVDEVADLLGPVEVLVSNAGVTRDALAVRMADEDFTAVIETNLTAAWRLSKLVMPAMMRARFGRLVFVASVGAFIGAPGQSNYAASKAGLIGLARSLAREYGTRGITANVVAPGPIDTDMLRALPEERRDALVTLVPAGRLGNVDDVATAVRFLASDAAGYVTGVVLPVDGGLSMGF